MPISAPIELDSWIEAFEPIARRIQNALGQVIESALGGPGRPNDLRDRFSLGGTMARRIYRAMQSDSAVDIALLLPGRPTMMRLIEHAEGQCPDPQLVTELREAYEAFYRQVSRIASTHQELSSVLSVHDPRILKESAERNRAMAFRVMSDIAGGNSEAVTAIWMMQPNSDDPTKGDSLWLHAAYGLRRLGMMKGVTVSSVASKNINKEELQTKRRVDGKPIDSVNGTVVRELSSENLPALTAVPTHDAVYSIFTLEDLPHGVPIDLVAGAINANWVRNIRPGEYDTERSTINVTTPSKLLHLDMLVHKDMWTGIEPDFRAYNTPAIPDSSYPGDFWFHEVDNYEGLTRIDAAELQRPIKEIPKHSKMVHYMLDHTGIDLADFRIYRLSIKFPVIGHSYWTYFSRRPDGLAKD